MNISPHNTINLSNVQEILKGKKVNISEETDKILNTSHHFLTTFAKDKIIYGINTGLGPMAQYKVAEENLVELQYNLIRSHSSGMGNPLNNDYVKIAMLARLKSVSQGFSGIHPSAVHLLKELINRAIFPQIPEHGGVGASGDLIQLAHLALVLIGEGKVNYKGEVKPTAEVFEKEKLTPISVVLREGLSLINGTSVMTGIGLVNLLKTKNLLNSVLLSSAMMNEIVASFDDHFSEKLNHAKQHSGQQEIAGMLRHILSDSQCISKRNEHFYKGTSINETLFKKKVQEYYSLRCLPQILGPVYETLQHSEKILIAELNSVSDNPIIDVENQTVHHGCNFHGDYVSMEMDKLKIAVTRLSMLSERQLNFILNPNLNGTLPPFVNLGTLGLNLGMQGMQFTATSTTAENQTLSNPMYVHSLPNNNDNQDIVSMGTNAALLTARVINNAFQVQAIHLLALVQAIDFLKIDKKISSKTQAVYKKIREIVPVFANDTAKAEEIEKIKKMIESNTQLLV